MYHIYTDGACDTLSRVGGWAAIILKNGEKTRISGRVEKTTSQRMELTAALKALEAAPPGEEIALHSDSQYLVGLMTLNWKRRANLDLLGTLDQLASSRRVQWLRESDASPLILEAHSLAQEALKGEASGPRLSHLDEAGRACMVDISSKAETERESVARGRVVMNPETVRLIAQGGLEKGDALALARAAGILAAKETPHLIPLCHPLLLSQVRVDFVLGEDSIEIEASAKTTGRTGVEMEALTAVAVAALTLYDMAKAVDPAMRIEAIRLVRKRGGKSGEVTLE